MGLPVWREPDANVESKSSLRTDPTAHARSSIRRRPSVHRASRRPLPVPRSPPPPPRNHVLPPLPSAAELRERVNQFPENSQRLIEFLRMRREERLQASGAETRRAQRHRIHESLVANTRAEVEERRRRQTPTVAVLSGDAETGARPLSRRGPADPMIYELPPLRRMNGRSINDADPPTLRHSTSMGQGFGYMPRSPSRSLSPDSDHWETLLSTITPDPSAPGTDSSFQSTGTAHPNAGRGNRPSIFVQRTSPPRSPRSPSALQSARPYTLSMPRSGTDLDYEAELSRLSRDQRASSSSLQRSAERMPLFGSFDQGEINSYDDIWPDVPPAPNCDEEEEEEGEGSQDESTAAPRSPAAMPATETQAISNADMIERLEMLLERTHEEMAHATEFNASVRAWANQFGSGENIPPGAEAAVRRHMLRMSDTLSEILSVADDTTRLINEAGLRHINYGSHERAIALEMETERRAQPDPE